MSDQKNTGGYQFDQQLQNEKNTRWKEGLLHVLL